ncbi:YsnF/AvaK domain-containing protein [Chryseosolibacter indicus]|uniref:DUF2382 domain-containing protein n=1 Tax=Chryseosolibacter indicus TaxID=2782351 RepID=A0ABS5VL07_9BACT|nr:YsnF/AvaK domain-containing protein [Chryseosolibacter indicus]MBT1702132.1 DUF2382 domain-containing protein [Chryseosolibacter indicus]
MKQQDREQVSATERTTIPVVEERLRVGAEVVETGSVRLKKDVEEKEVVIDASLAHDHITIERVKINRPVATPPPAVRYEGNTMIVSVLKEEVVVQKQLVLVEELHISKESVQEHSETPVKLRREKVSIEQGEAGANT